MIHSLRQNHRRIIIALTMVLPLILVASLLVRKPFPVTQQIPKVIRILPGQVTPQAPHKEGATP